MRVEGLFSSAGVTPRSHNLTSSGISNVIVYASGVYLVVENVPCSTSECGYVESVSARHHTKSITVVKRSKSWNNADVFTSGGSDGKINLWKLVGNKLENLITISAGDTSVISVTTAVKNMETVVLGSWGEELSGSFEAWWLKDTGEGLQMMHKAEMSNSLIKRSFILAMDCHIMSDGFLLAAVGTSLRRIELYSEEDNTFTRRLSVVGHTDWIHSIAFNDCPNNLLLASAGQDTFIKLWKVESSGTAQDDDELSVTKNRFTILRKEEVQQLCFNVEAVICGHEDWVHSTEWSSNGKKLMTASSDKTVIVWEEQNELWGDVTRLGIIGGQAAGFFGAVFTADSRSIVASSYFGGLHSWRAGEDETAAWEPITLMGGHVDEVRDVCWSPKGEYLMSVGKDQTTRVYAPQKTTGHFVEVARPQVHGYDMQCLVSVSASCFVSGGEEKILRAFRAPETFANSLCSIAGYSKRDVFANQTLETFGARLPALGLSNKVIDERDQPAEEESHWEEAAFQANPVNLTAAPSEDCLQQSTLWPELHKLYGHGFEVYATACNPRATVVATACKASHPDHAKIILWDVSAWGKKNSIPGHQLTVTQIEWSPDGRYLMSVSRDRTAVIYKESNGDLDGFAYEKIWTSGKEHSRIIWSCSWLSDSLRFVTASRDQKVILWRIHEEKASNFASIKLSHPVTAISTGNGTLGDVVACGLQDGSLSLLLVDNDQLKLAASTLQPPVSIDSPVSCLRFCPKSSNNTGLLAFAGSDGLTRVLKISI